jgi:hypothetical protein
MADPSPAPPAASPRQRWARRAAITLASLVALVVLAWLAVPPIVRGQLESRLTEALGRKTTVEKVAFDPFTLKLTVTKLSIAEPSGASTFASCDEIVADLSSASLWHRAPVLDSLRLVRPSIALARDRDGRYSVQDLIDRPPPEPAGDDAKSTPRFSINNIEVDDGAIAFDDGVAGRKHTLAKLGLGIPFISSLPYQTDIRVTPRAEGAINGSHFALGGSSVPFAERREASIGVDLDALPLKEYLAYLPSRLRVDVAGGALTTRLKVVFVDGKPDERRLELRGDVRVDGLDLRRRDGSALVAAERIAATLDRVDVFGRDAKLASVAVDAPRVDVRRLADGTIELARPLMEPVAARAGAPSPPEKPWSVAIGRASVARGTVKLADAGSSFASTLVDVAIDAANLSTRPGDKAQVKVAFVTDDRIASFKGEAEVEPMRPAASGRFELAKFSLGLLFPYYKDALAVDVQKGSLAYASRFAYADGRFTLSEGEGTIDDLRLAFPGVKEPLWRVPQLTAKGVDVDVAARKVAIGEVQSRGATLRIARERDGTLEAARLVKTTRATGTSADATWTLGVKRLALERAALDVEDRVPDPAVKLAAREVALVVTDYSNARGARSSMTLQARLGERGRLSVAGPLTTNPFAIDARVDASGVALVPLKQYAESRVNILLAGGVVAAKGRLALDASDPAGAKATWKGNVAVTDFAALDKPTSSDLARWKALALDDLDVTSAPFRLSVARIALDDYYARVIVYPDGTLNLTRLLTPGQEPEPAPQAAPATVALVPEKREALPIAVGKLELAHGNVNLSDFFVRPNYSANLTDVAGTITATSAEKAGDVAISARVDRTAPVEVTGRLQPFAKELSLDLHATARDVDLPPLTPYSVKYAGYGIEKGKITFDVHYKVEDRKLAAENRLVLDQLTFNRQRVDSPTATKLPVLLAVALLQDRNGVIDLQVPISGTLDDPKFSVFGIIVQVIVNLIGKAATAPFALLASAFGGGPELSTVPFAAGSDRLDDEGRKRVETLGKALGDRPGLKLEIGGRADPAGDRDALVHASLDGAIKRAKMKSLAAAGQAPASLDAVSVGADERNRWLTAAYQDAPLPNKPRNVIGMLKELPPAEMEAMLVSSAKVDDDALRLLANARAQAVKDALAAKGVAGERLFLTAPKLGAEPAAQAATAAAPAASRVDLALR